MPRPAGCPAACHAGSFSPPMGMLSASLGRGPVGEGLSPFHTINVTQARTRKAYLQTNTTRLFILPIPFLRETGNGRERNACSLVGQVELDHSKCVPVFFQDTLKGGRGDQRVPRRDYKGREPLAGQQDRGVHAADMPRARLCARPGAGRDKGGGGGQDVYLGHPWPWDHRLRVEHRWRDVLEVRGLVGKCGVRGVECRCRATWWGRARRQVCSSGGLRVPT